MVSDMIDTDDLDNMSRRDLVELLEAYNESLAEVKRLREELRLTKEWLDQLYDEDLVSAFRFHVYGDD